MQGCLEYLPYIALEILIFILVVLYFFRNPPRTQPTKPLYSSAESFCEALIDGFKAKARHNKNESMLWFLITMSGSLLAPLLVSLGGDSFLLAKVIPSVLSGVVAFGTAWLQLRKPQHLWALYRGCQRKLEDNLARYKFKVDDYHDGDIDVLLARRCAEIAMEAHNEWLPIMPKGEKGSSGGAKGS